MRQRSMLASVAILIGIILASAVVPSGQAIAQNGVELGNNTASSWGTISSPSPLWPSPDSSKPKGSERKTLLLPYGKAAIN